MHSTAPALTSVVFDIGNVFLRWDIKNLYRQIFATEAEIDAFLAETNLPAMNKQFDGGRLFADGLHELATQFPHHHAAIMAFDPRWADCLDGEIAENIELLFMLKRVKIPVYAISNFSREKFDIARHVTPALDAFDHAIISADHAVIKPDLRIYELLISETGLDPSTAIFIDDVLENIESAEAVGYQTYHFPNHDTESCMAFRSRLKAGGLVF
jgi:FMN phosphatase YigB (HAD superfamily)